MLTLTSGIKRKEKSRVVEGPLKAVILDFSSPMWPWQRQNISLSHIHHSQNGNNKLPVECYMD